MEARRINLEPYEYDTGQKMRLPKPDGTLDERPVMADYNVRETLVNIILHPGRRMGGLDFLRAEELSRKILDESKAEVLLAEDDYAKLRAAVEQFKGYGRHDSQMLHRVMDAEIVQLEAVNTPPSDKQGA